VQLQVINEFPFLLSFSLPSTKLVTSLILDLTCRLELQWLPAIDLLVLWREEIEIQGKKYKKSLSCYFLISSSSSDSKARWLRMDAENMYVKPRDIQCRLLYSWSELKTKKAFKEKSKLISFNCYFFDSLIQMNESERSLPTFFSLFFGSFFQRNVYFLVVSVLIFQPCFFTCSRLPDNAFLHEKNKLFSLWI